MGYGRRRYSSNIKQNSTFSLNITSMTDMFTIMLVFLLQTYSTAEVQLNPEKDVNLPLSNVEANPTPGLKVSVSPQVLKIEDEVLMNLKEGEFSAGDVDKNDKNYLPTLFTKLRTIAEEKKDQKDIQEGHLILMADSSLSYDAIKKVMYTASMAGFPKLKMATVVGK